MNKYNFLDLKSSEIDKFYSSTNGTYMPLRAPQNQIFTFFSENEIKVANIYLQNCP